MTRRKVSQNFRRVRWICALRPRDRECRTPHMLVSSKGGSCPEPATITNSSGSRSPGCGMVLRHFAARQLDLCASPSRSRVPHSAQVGQRQEWFLCEASDHYQQQRLLRPACGMVLRHFAARQVDLGASHPRSRFPHFAQVGQRLEWFLCEASDHYQQQRFPQPSRSNGSGPRFGAIAM